MKNKKIKNLGIYKNYNFFKFKEERLICIGDVPPAPITTVDAPSSTPTLATTEATVDATTATAEKTAEKLAKPKAHRETVSEKVQRLGELIKYFMAKYERFNIEKDIYGLQMAGALEENNDHDKKILERARYGLREDCKSPFLRTEFETLNKKISTQEFLTVQDLGLPENSANINSLNIKIDPETGLPQKTEDFLKTDNGKSIKKHLDAIRIKYKIQSEEKGGISDENLTAMYLKLLIKSNDTSLNTKPRETYLQKSLLDTNYLIKDDANTKTLFTKYPNQTIENFLGDENTIKSIMADEASSNGFNNDKFKTQMTNTGITDINDFYTAKDVYINMVRELYPIYNPPVYFIDKFALEIRVKEEVRS